MTAYASTWHHFTRSARIFFEHAATTIAGFILMILGLAMGVTMVLLPVGLVVGLIGVMMFVGGLFARIDGSR